MSRFVQCPMCSACVPAFKINEHLDSHLDAAEVSSAAAPSLTTPMTGAPAEAPSARPTAVSLTVTPPPPPSSTSPALLSTPLARAFGIAPAPPAVTVVASQELTFAAYMPAYTNRLHDVCYPGGGTALCCDLRRRNSWVSMRGSSGSSANGGGRREGGDAGEGGVGGALALLCRHVLLMLATPEGCLTAPAEAPAPPSPLLTATETMIAQHLASARQSAALTAHALASPGVWVRLQTLPAPLASGAASGGAAPSAVCAAAWAAALEDCEAHELLEVLRSSPPPSPPPSLPSLLTPLATLPVRVLRELHTQTGLGPPAAAALAIGSSSGVPPSSGARDGTAGAAGAAGAVTGAEPGPSLNIVLAQQLVAALGRRRKPDLSPLLQALGPCVRLRPEVASALHRLSVVGFVNCGYRPEEAACMLRGHAGLTTHTRFGGAAALATAPTRFGGAAALATAPTRFGGAAALATARAHASAALPSAAPLAAAPLASAAVHRLRCRDDLEHLLACLALTDRMEAGLGTSATASVVLSAADEAHARLMHLAVPDTAWEMGGGSASFAAAVLARAVLAGCAQLRRDGRKPDSVARLRSLLGCDGLPCDL